MSVAGTAYLALPAATRERDRHPIPYSHRPTPDPTAATTPANSCPGTIGSGTGSCPRHACQSERHTPVAITRTSTPPAGHSGSGTSTSTGTTPYAG